MKKIFYFLIACLLMFPLCTRAQKEITRPLDIVFCLDLSGSTNGLVNDVRDNLWLIANELNALQPKPDFRLGVVCFSRPSFGKSNGYVKVFSDLTYNLDYIDAELYKLKPSIEKGDQIVSAALSIAVSDMSWSKKDNALKLIYIVGNGSVSSNGYEYVKICESAVEKKIIVNSVFVTKSANKASEMAGWKRIAAITGGIQTELTVNKKDPLNFWNSNIASLVKQNTILYNDLQWSGPDSSLGRKSMVTCDSGAFEAGVNTYCHRLFHKSSAYFIKSIKYCDYFAKLKANNGVGDFRQSVNDTTIESMSAFDQRAYRMQAERNRKLQMLRLEVGEEGVQQLFQEYSKPDFKDEGIFHRIVLLSAIQQWNK
ncbi:MAG: hypothetical protein ACKOX3_08065 [Bacteroidota bacterium]